MSIKQRIKGVIPQSVLDRLISVVSTVISAVDFLATIRKKYRDQRYLIVRLDTNNRCNLRCRYCYTLSLEREKRRIMSVDAFRLLANRLFAQANVVNLSCVWEPLMNKEFIQYIKIASEYGIPHLRFVTNGQLLNDEIMLTCINAPVHQISISLDAATKGIYEDIRVNGSFDKVIGNLKRIDSLKKASESVYPKVNIKFTAFDENAQEAPQVIRKYGRYFDMMTVQHLKTRIRNESCQYSRMPRTKFEEMIRECRKEMSGTSLSLISSFNTIRRPKLLCSTALKSLIISCDGDVTMCTKMVMGNIFVDRLKEIFQRNRKSFLKMYFARHDCCKHCRE